MPTLKTIPSLAQSLPKAETPAGSSPTITDAHRQQARQVIKSKWPRLYLARYHHRATDGQRLTFRTRPWLIPIYKDNSEKIVVCKASQVCMTDWALCELFSAAMQGDSVMYVLPTDMMVYDFSPRRIDKTIARVDLYRTNYLQKRKDSDSKKQKTLFGVDCFIVGSNSEKNFFEKPVQRLIIDEVDLCDQSNLGFAYDRLGAATDKDGRVLEIWRKIGNPSVVGTGIDAEYQESDKKIWLVPCVHCNEWQPLDWFVNIVRDEGGGHFSLRDNSVSSLDPGGRDARAFCRRCNKPIDRLATGEWVAEYPSRPISGYRVNKLFGDPRGGQVVMALFNKYQKALKNQDKLQKFYNQDLGLPFTGSGFKFTRELLEAAARDYSMPMQGTGTVAGVDVGSVLHLHIAKTKASGIGRMLFVGTVPDWDELHNVCNRYGVQCGVVDHMPEKHAAEEFVAAHPGWYVCDYNLADTSKVPIEVDEINQVIRVNRTSSLDESMERWLDNRWELPQDWESLDGGDFVTQMCASTRVQKEDAQGNVKFIWTKCEDHHQHTNNYLRIAMDQGIGSIVTVG